MRIFKTFFAMLVMAQLLSAQVTTHDQQPAGTTRVPQQSKRGAAVQGVVHDEAMNPPLGVKVTLRALADNNVRSAESSAEGIFRFTDLPAGEYEIQAGVEEGKPVSARQFKLAPGEVLTVEIKISGRAAERMRSVLPEIKAAEEEPSAPVQTLPMTPSQPAEAVEVRLEPEDVQITFPAADRWAMQPQEWRRYGHEGDYPNARGHWWDPFNLNRIKGDYPVLGQDIFFNFTGTSVTAVDFRRLPKPSNVASARPNSANFFGRQEQFFLFQTFRLSFELFKGDTTFRPQDWRIRITPAINVNYLRTQERGIVNADVRKGTNRTDAHFGLQEAFFEYKIADLSPRFDFVSVRAGIQLFNSDFRGFIYVDEQPGVRLFGNLHSNRWQYNAAYFHLLEKDTNSVLNTFERRHQQVMVANLYIQDFLTHGYTTQFSYHFNKDDATFHFDHNDFLVRPAPVGSVTPHDVRAHYLGWTGNGRMGRFNISHAAYQVLGFDSLNPLEGRRVDINARMGALEVSYDKDWKRYRASFMYASGDSDPRDGHARGFDSIVDATAFAGGQFSFFNRQGIRLTGTGVMLQPAESFFPSFRSNKEEGQANFVNPGLFLANAGADFELTPKLRAVVNANFLWFDRTEPLEFLLFQKPVRRGIGGDYGLGFIYRPALSENMSVTGGISALTPWRGLRDIYTGQTLYSGFAAVRFQF